MTDLQTSPVTRRTTVMHKHRRIVVTLRADDTIELRLERARTGDNLRIPILDLLSNPARWSSASIPQRTR